LFVLVFHFFWSTDCALLLQAPAPAVEEPAAPTEEPAPADAKPEETPAPEPAVEAAPAPAEPIKEAETPAPVESEAPVPETTSEEAKKEEKEEKLARSPVKIGRRLSARVGEFFKTRSKDVSPPAKVDEAPPKIEEPTPVAPLENPAADSTPAAVEENKKEETNETNEPPKIVEATPAPATVAA